MDVLFEEVLVQLFESLEGDQHLVGIDYILCSNFAGRGGMKVLEDLGTHLEVVIEVLLGDKQYLVRGIELIHHGSHVFGLGQLNFSVTADPQVSLGKSETEGAHEGLHPDPLVETDPMHLPLPPVCLHSIDSTGGLGST